MEDEKVGSEGWTLRYLNRQDELCRRTALFAAAAQNEPGLVLRLLDASADPLVPCEGPQERNLALHAACRAGYIEVVDVLLGHCWPMDRAEQLRVRFQGCRT